MFDFPTSQNPPLHERRDKEGSRHKRLSFLGIPFAGFTGIGIE
jgi:hypothetical protein